MVGLEGFQLEVLLVGHMELQEKAEKERQRSLFSILVALLQTFIKRIDSRTEITQTVSH